MIGEKMKKVHLVFTIFILMVFCFLGSCAEMDTADDTTPSIPKSRIPQTPTSKGIEFTLEGQSMMGGSYTVPLPEGDSYNINRPFENLLRDWAELNFGSIEDNSLNDIVVTIKNMDYDGGNNTFLKSIYLQVNIKGSIQDKFFDKNISLSQSFTRSSAADPNFKGSTLAVKAKTNINRFLMQLVEKIDNYLKQDLGVKKL
jgi:hypothetical protein